MSLPKCYRRFSHFVDVCVHRAKVARAIDECSCDSMPISCSISHPPTLLPHLYVSRRHRACLCIPAGRPSNIVFALLPFPWRLRGARWPDNPQLEHLGRSTGRVYPTRVRVETRAEHLEYVTALAPCSLRTDPIVLDPSISSSRATGSRISRNVLRSLILGTSGSYLSTIAADSPAQSLLLRSPELATPR